jgi:hypothetical protein
MVGGSFISAPKVAVPAENANEGDAMDIEPSPPAFLKYHSYKTRGSLSVNVPPQSAVLTVPGTDVDVTVTALVVFFAVLPLSQAAKANRSATARTGRRASVERERTGGKGS